MQTVFLSGPLAWGPLLAVALGEADAGLGKTARLKGAGVIQGLATCFPPLVPRQGAEATGLLLEIGDDEIFARLSFFAAAIGLAAVPKHIEVAGEARGSVTFLAADASNASPEAPWNEDAWAARWGAVACDAAAEIMGYFQQKAPEDLGWRMPMILSRASARVAARADQTPARLRSATPASAVELRARENAHEGYFLTQILHLRHPGFDGQQSEELRREAFVASDAAIVLPYDPLRDRVLLVEQFRMGPYGRGDPRPWVLEPVAGRLDAGETPQDTALRECREESGLELRSLEHISSHYCSPGYSTEFYYCFLGLADLPDTGPGRGGVEAEHEDIRTHVISFNEAMALVGSGEANIGPLVLMLLWLQRERPRLRSLA